MYFLTLDFIIVQLDSSFIIFKTLKIMELAKLIKNISVDINISLSILNISNLDFIILLQLKIYIFESNDT